MFKISSLFEKLRKDQREVPKARTLCVFTDISTDGSDHLLHAHTLKRETPVPKLPATPVEGEFKPSKTNRVDDVVVTDRRWT